MEERAIAYLRRQQRTRNILFSVAHIVMGVIMLKVGLTFWHDDHRHYAPVPHPAPLRTPAQLGGKP